MTVPTSFRVAVLVNSKSSLDPAFNAAFQRSITNARPDAQIELFDPIEAQIYPEPGQFNLIVLTGGGTADATAEDVPWVMKMREFLTKTAEENPTQKIVGVCWGHEIIHIAFGGVLGPMDLFEVCGFSKRLLCISTDVAPKVGVMPVALNDVGSSFFSKWLPSAEKLNIHEFHEMEVKNPGRGFTALAESNQITVNAANTILTFQGHPEMDAELSTLLLNETKQYSGRDEAEKDATRKRINSPHDGAAVWKRIMHWTEEL